MELYSIFRGVKVWVVVGVMKVGEDKSDPPHGG